MKTQITENLIIMRERSGLSYEALSEKTSFSKSTLHRWFSGEAAPSVDDLPILVDAMSGDIGEIYKSVARQEMVATQNIDYEGATSMVARYETEISALRERLSLINDHHDREISNMRDHYEHNINLMQNAHDLALKKRDETYERSVTYLKEQVREMRLERAQLHQSLAEQTKRADDHAKRADNLDSKRHNIFWILGIICSCLSVGLVIALFSNPII